ncbi:MAG: hypothetical protein EOM72_13665 [Opitutae bacterium]|nr:hypothetical protein [Opitutae bacterium]
MGQAKRRGRFDERRAAALAEARIRAESAAGAARNMVGMTNAEVYEWAEIREERAAGCLAVAVCGIGVAACVAACLLFCGPCRRVPETGPECLAANIAAGVYGDEMCGDEPAEGR